jgi:hypothetical protein
MSNFKIKKDEQNPETPELLAKSIIQVSDAACKLLNSGINQDAIITLLHRKIGAANISRDQITMVLNGIPKLKGWYCK